jgi:methionyl aminopeptidase
LASLAKPGVSTKLLDDEARRLTLEGGDTPSFLDYTPDGADRPYPASVCISINDEIIHGIPNEDPKILKDGDIVSIDMGIKHKGLFTDSAITVGVGKIDTKAKKLLKATEEGMFKGIAMARGGAHIGDIGAEIEAYALKNGFEIADDLCGHGVGYAVHEDPYIPNYGVKGEGDILRPGMVIAIEPMYNEGTGRVKALSDGYTYVTADGKRSAHFEHTILITDGAPEILTR